MGRNQLHINALVERRPSIQLILVVRVVIVRSIGVIVQCAEAKEY